MLHGKVCDVFWESKHLSLVWWWWCWKPNFPCHFRHFRFSTGLLFKQNRSLLAMYHYQLCKYNNVIRNLTASAHGFVSSSFPFSFLLAWVTLAKATKLPTVTAAHSNFKFSGSKVKLTSQVMVATWHLNSKAKANKKKICKPHIDQKTPNKTQQ